MLVKKMNYIFRDKASVGGYGVISSFFELSIFFVQEGYGFSLLTVEYFMYFLLFAL
jgi:hypothetical protein